MKCIQMHFMKDEISDSILFRNERIIVLENTLHSLVTYFPFPPEIRQNRQQK